MEIKLAAIVFAILLAPLCCPAADSAAPAAIEIVVTEGSAKVGGIELRNLAPKDDPRFFSLAAAEKALGHPQSKYTAGVGVRYYAWTDHGVGLLMGLRGPEKGQFFKFQVWLEDYHDKAAGKHSGVYRGQVQVDGVAIGPGTTFDSIREPLKAKGYTFTEPEVAAQKGEISIFGDAATKRIQRVDVWPRL